MEEDIFIDNFFVSQSKWKIRLFYSIRKVNRDINAEISSKDECIEIYSFKTFGFDILKRIDDDAWWKGWGEFLSVKIMQNTNLPICIDDFNSAMKKLRKDLREMMNPKFSLERKFA